MNGGGQSLWNVIAIYAMFEISYMNGILKNTVSRTIILFGATFEDHPMSTEDLARLHQIFKKVLSGFF